MSEKDEFEDSGEAPDRFLGAATDLTSLASEAGGLLDNISGHEPTELTAVFERLRLTVRSR
jgi:hypothetical protein